jgi:hypothetical protein
MEVLPHRDKFLFPKRGKSTKKNQMLSVLGVRSEQNVEWWLEAWSEQAVGVVEEQKKSISNYSM